jgi:hypothetical protein
MESTIQQVVATVLVVAACLSAQVGLLALGCSFRVSARMAAPTEDRFASVPEPAGPPLQIATTSLPGGRW